MKEMRKELAVEAHQEDAEVHSTALYEAVEMEVPYEVEYTSEEEEESEDPFDMNKQADQQSVSLSNSDRALLSPAISPTNHRNRVKQKKVFAMKRLTSTVLGSTPDGGSPRFGHDLLGNTTRGTIKKVMKLQRKRSL